MKKKERPTWNSCKLGRKIEARKLKRYIENIHEGRNGSHILNIDAKWGEGKTHFLKLWKNELSINHLVVYWDAWQTDFSDDPLVSFFYTLNTAIEEYATSTTGSRIRQFLTKELNLATLCNDVLRVSSRSYMALHGINGEIDIQNLVTTYLMDDKRDTLIAYKQDRKHIEALENALIELSKKIGRCQSQSLPIFILIDELDRCRPIYALTLLERVKHLFNVKGFQFIIATDTEQLQHTVKSVYGIGFDAKRYLKRFFDIQYSFPDAEPEVHAKYLFDQSNSILRKYLFIPRRSNSNPTSLWAPDSIFCDFSLFFKWSMRDRIQIYERLDAILRLYFRADEAHIIPLLYFLGLQHITSDEEYRSFSKHSEVKGDKLISIGFVNGVTENRYPTYQYHQHGRKSAETRLITLINFYLEISTNYDDVYKRWNTESLRYTHEDEIFQHILQPIEDRSTKLPISQYPGLIAHMGFHGFQSDSKS